jgi:putative ABC transport system permease protein
VIAFGAMVRDAVNRGQVTASWLATGADAVVGEADSGISLTPVAQRAIAAVPGVRRSATTLDTTGAVGTYNAGGTQLNICVLDPVSYAAVLAGTPAPQFPAAKLARGQERDGRVPVLASPAAASLIKHAGKIVTVGIRSVPVQIVGTIRSTPAVPQGGTFIIYPRWATAHSNVIPPDVMFLNAPHLDQRALAAVVRRTAPDAELTLRSQLLAGYRAAPLPHAGYLAFAEGAVAAAGFCVLILLLMLVLGARARELTLARLTTMGLSRSQARRLAAVETLPAILAATVGGLACAWAMAPLVGPELDLSVFTNGALSVPVYADAPALIITAAALVLLTLATLTVQAFVASRRASQLLRIEG